MIGRMNGSERDGAWGGMAVTRESIPPIDLGVTHGRSRSTSAGSVTAVCGPRTIDGREVVRVTVTRSLPPRPFTHPVPTIVRLGLQSLGFLSPRKTHDGTVGSVTDGSDRVRVTVTGT